MQEWVAEFCPWTSGFRKPTTTVFRQYERDQFTKYQIIGVRMRAANKSLMMSFFIPIWQEHTVDIKLFR